MGLRLRLQRLAFFWPFFFAEASGCSAVRRGALSRLERTTWQCSAVHCSAVCWYKAASGAEKLGEAEWQADQSARAARPSVCLCGLCVPPLVRPSTSRCVAFHLSLSALSGGCTHSSFHIDWLIRVDRQHHPASTTPPPPPPSDPIAADPSAGPLLLLTRLDIARLGLVDGVAVISATDRSRSPSVMSAPTTPPRQQPPAAAQPSGHALTMPPPAHHLAIPTTPTIPGQISTTTPLPSPPSHPAAAAATAAPASSASSSRPSSKAPVRKVGKYQLGKTLGQGTFGKSVEWDQREKV